VTELRSERIPWAALDLWRFHVTPTNPELRLPLGRRAAVDGCRIELIKPPDEGETRWTVMATQPMVGGVMPTTAELDAKYDWHVSRKLVEYPNGARSTIVMELDRVGGRVTPVTSQLPMAAKLNARCVKCCPRKKRRCRIEW
jgi:hypothetical protein